MTPEMYEGPKWAEKKAAFEANSKFRLLREDWVGMERVPRAELTAEILRDMGKDNVRFLAYLLGRDEKTIRNDLLIAALNQESKLAIAEGHSLASVLKQPRLASCAQPAEQQPVSPATSDRQDKAPASAAGNPGGRAWVNPLLESLRRKNPYDV